MKFTDFSKKLISWYQRNYRTLPWRESSDPYFIWLSEIILQQTRVNQGLPYYEKFVSSFPTINDLAVADENRVLRLWQGLGYYSRARNLLKCARIVVKEHDGLFPNNYTDLLKLPGIGKYTAAAIASIAYKQPVAVVDGNVYRVLSRVFGLDKDISESSALEYFKKLSEELISEEHPDLYNQALMEHGATICLPVNPKCDICIFRNECYAFETKSQERLPVKTKKVKVRERRFFYVLFYNDNGCLMKKRNTKDIWAEMYDLLWIETADFENHLNLSEKIDPNILNESREIYFSPVIKHALSHQRLETSFVKVFLDVLPESLTLHDQRLSYFSWSEVTNLPKPVLVNNYLLKQSFIDQL